MKVAIFLDYIGAIGGGERVALMLARALKGDIITTDVSAESIRRLGFTDVNVISLGSTIKFPPLKQISASFMFAACDFAKDYDFFIFSGNWSHYAARKTSSEPLVLLHSSEGLLRSEKRNGLTAAELVRKTAGGHVDWDSQMV